ncbi:hypothetical protein [Nocardiopsis sp. FIRDI 009]|uniref:hypothetical protein n=1 Tax=Nocardiopsis sp. FIRDI 009 TaxID=714197 RepID=UPI000E24A37F|nr:hypothetical protein [Nocardiopsis sp. FIRDI 009]
MAGTRDGAVHGRWWRAPAARTGVGAAAAAAVLVLGACSGGDGGGGEPEMRLGDSGLMAAVDPPDTGPEGFTPAEVAGIAINVPEGWEVQSEGDSLCMTPPGQAACAYGSVRLVARAAANHPQGWPNEGEAFRDENGWAANTDNCRSLNTAASGNIGVEGATLTVSDFFEDHADGLTSHHAEWEVRCVNGENFEVRMWFLPISDVLLYVWSADPQYDEVYTAIAASMDTTGYRG